MNNVTERLESKINKMTAQSHSNKQIKTNDSKYIFILFFILKDLLAWKLKIFENKKRRNDQSNEIDSLKILFEKTTKQMIDQLEKTILISSSK